MRDISRKVTTLRTAIARSVLKMSPTTVKLLKKNTLPKGDALSVARIAAVQAAKNTSQLIPFCHPLPIDHVDCRFELSKDRVSAIVEVRAIYKTGVEMEALTGASIAALTIYDMVKAVDEKMEVVSVSLVEKRGGKSDIKENGGTNLRAGVLVISDSVASGSRQDASGTAAERRLKQEGFRVVRHDVVPDNVGEIESHLQSYADVRRLDLVLTVGGTGLGPRDVTPEATSRLLQREIPGIAEAMRSYSQQRMPFAMLSRARAGARGRTVIINLPGSTRGVQESLDALFPALHHIFRMLAGEGHSTTA